MGTDGTIERGGAARKVRYHRFVKCATRRVFRCLRWLRPLTWLRRIAGQSGDDGLTELYVVAITVVQALLFVYPGCLSGSCAVWLSAWLLAAMLLGLVDIQLFHAERARDAAKNGGLGLDPVRSVILVGFNLVQTVFAFALFYRHLPTGSLCIHLTRNLSNWDWLSLSVMTLTAFGDQSITPASALARCLVSAEIVVGMFMTVVVIANFASLLLGGRSGSHSQGDGPLAC